MAPFDIVHGKTEGGVKALGRFDESACPRQEFAPGDMERLLVGKRSTIAAEVS